MSQEDIEKALRNPTLKEEALIDSLCVAFEQALRGGKTPAAEDFLKQAPSHLEAPLSSELTLIAQDFAQEQAAATPSIAGYYDLVLIGEGASGQVYRAVDSRLERSVAIKIAKFADAAPSGGIEEARIIAGLDHPHIVPVFAVGQLDDGRPYFVSKLINGRSLSEQLSASAVSQADGIRIVAQVADALHSAHLAGIVHRDIKPANILLDADLNAYLTDFGLALKDQEFGQGFTYVGTPSYMSPEQASAKGHLVDGRSDIFSLGSVLYELLTERRPFEASTRSQLREYITTVEPRPLRQINDQIPASLEKVCLTALAKDQTQRYSTAKDFANALRAAIPSRHSIGDEGQTALLASRGLRPFDERDAEAFCTLLPGPYGNDGTPESLEWWIERIESSSPDSKNVGLIYGPSGCGKTSFVRAGILPRLSPGLQTIYLEANEPTPEQRTLVQRLRAEIEACTPQLDTKGLRTLPALIKKAQLQLNRRVLIVLDQFEQWLHSEPDIGHSELVLALKELSGPTLQFLLVVRDDFWLATHRFMQALGIPIAEGTNASVVDLFDVRHARRVFERLGRASGELPPLPQALTESQQEFIHDAIDSLQVGGRVVCVQLTLLAEIMKYRPWVPETLSQLGGSLGAAAAYLEGLFEGPSAPIELRPYCVTAKAILHALLPEDRSELRGRVRSLSELAESCGKQPAEIAPLLQLLDRRFNLVCKPPRPPATESHEAFFQLTHDYLIPALKEWLLRTQRRSRRGRAQLLLRDRANQWAIAQDSRLLLTATEWISSRSMTSRASWAPQERLLIRKSGRRHLMRLAILLVLLALALFLFGQWRAQQESDREQSRARDLVDRLTIAQTRNVPDVIEAMEPLRELCEPLLQQQLTELPEGGLGATHAHLAFAANDPQLASAFLAAHFPAEPTMTQAMSRVLHPYRSQLTPKLWKVLRETMPESAPCLAAAMLLASWEPADSPENRSSWLESMDVVAAKALWGLTSYPGQSSTIIDSLRPLGKKLVGPLIAQFKDANRSTAQRSAAAGLLGEYASNRPELLADLIVDCEPHDFEGLYRRGAKLRAQFQQRLREHFEVRKDTTDPRIANACAKRRANVAIAMFRLGNLEPLWSQLDLRPDPSPRHELIHRIARSGIPARELEDYAQTTESVGRRLSLVLCLHEYSAMAISTEFKPILLHWFTNHPDSGLHSACELLLKKLGYHERLKARDSRAGGPESVKRWMMNSEGQTMIIVDAPIQFAMGSLATEPDRQNDEPRFRCRIDTRYAIASTEVTVEQFRRFMPDFDHRQFFRSPTSDCPVLRVDWHRAAAYCNWLSQREGIPEAEWCYRKRPGISGFEMEASPSALSLQGYRLPSEKEWEFAARAGTTSSRYYGWSDSLLPAYAHCNLNADERSWPVGSKLPNDFGLFDVLGNAMEWCHDLYLEDPRAEVPPTGAAAMNRVLRGGAYYNQPGLMRSADRVNQPPNYASESIGFRIARTLP